MTKLYWIAGLVFIVALCGVAFFYFRASPEGISFGTTPYTNPYSYANGTATQPSGGQSAGQTSSTSGQTVAAEGGGTIPVRNFLQDSDTVSDVSNPGQYFLGNSINPASPTASATPPYVIEYISSTQYFNIALLQEPLSAARSQAEQYLMAKLGITPTEMCNLNYTVTTSLSVDPTYAGESLGFSFCPGAVQLP